jgi:hypothetical protein
MREVLVSRFHLWTVRFQTALCLRRYYLPPFYSKGLRHSLSLTDGLAQFNGLEPVRIGQNTSAKTGSLA